MLYNKGRQITNEFFIEGMELEKSILLRRVQDGLIRGQLLFDIKDLPNLGILMQPNSEYQMFARKAHAYTRLILAINDLLPNVSAGEADLEVLQVVARQRGMDQEVALEEIIRILTQKLKDAYLGTPFDPESIDFLIEIRDDRTTPPLLVIEQT
jgi:hypothetical protein